jgi:putative acetyltransferase
MTLNITHRIRPYTPHDALQTARVFYDAVHIGTAAVYNEEQRHAWAPEIPTTPLWGQRLSNATTMVSEQGGKIVGFMSLTGAGMIDMAFVTPSVMGSVVAADLYDKITAIARSKDMVALGTEASFLARKFFLKRGWREVSEQSVDCNGVDLTNFIMAKYLK